MMYQPSQSVCNKAVSGTANFGPAIEMSAKLSPSDIISADFAIRAIYCKQTYLNSNLQHIDTIITRILLKNTFNTIIKELKTYDISLNNALFEIPNATIARCFNFTQTFTKIVLRWQIVDLISKACKPKWHRIRSGIFDSLSMKPDYFDYITGEDTMLNFHKAELEIYDRKNLVSRLVDLGVELDEDNESDLFELYNVPSKSRQFLNRIEKEPSKEHEIFTDALIETLEEPDSGLRKWAVRAIARTMPSDEAIEILIKKLEDRNEEVRFWAGYDLGIFGRQAKKALARLEEMIERGDELVPCALRDTIKRIEGESE